MCSVFVVVTATAVVCFVVVGVAGSVTVTIAHYLRCRRCSTPSLLQLSLLLLEGVCFIDSSLYLSMFRCCFTPSRIC